MQRSRHSVACWFCPKYRAPEVGRTGLPQVMGPVPTKSGLMGQQVSLGPTSLGSVWALRPAEPATHSANRLKRIVSFPIQTRRTLRNRWGRQTRRPSSAQHVRLQHPSKADPRGLSANTVPLRWRKGDWRLPGRARTRPTRERCRLDGSPHPLCHGEWVHASWTGPNRPRRVGLSPRQCLGSGPACVLRDSNPPPPPPGSHKKKAPHCAQRQSVQPMWWSMCSAMSITLHEVHITHAPPPLEPSTASGVPETHRKGRDRYALWALLQVVLRVIGGVGAGAGTVTPGNRRCARAVRQQTPPWCLVIFHSGVASPLPKKFPKNIQKILTKFN